MTLPLAAGGRRSGTPSSRASARALPGAYLAVVGALSSLGLTSLEVLCALLRRRAEVSSVWELHTGLPLLLPAALVVAVIAGTTGAAAFWLLGRAEQSRSARLALGLAVALGAALAGYGVGGGRHLASPSARLSFALLVAAAAFAGVRFTARLLSREMRRRPVAFSLGAALAILALEVANHWLLVRLYPAFHGTLAILAWTLAAWVTLPLVRRGPAQARWSALGLVCGLAAGLAFARPTAEKLARFDNLRWLLIESAPLAAQLVELNGRLSPPLPLLAPDADSLTLAGSGPRTLDFRARDLLLVTIDALRADHVGAYGYERSITPNLDALARRGTVFEAAYCPTPHTSYSVTSLMTGKYMRPLLMQGAGEDSDTWASLLRTYGYRTAAFYPPAIFFIDPARFQPFQRSFLGFEYRWVEFAEGDKRVAQVAAYLKAAPKDHPVFVWVHLFGPHEPYEKQAGLELGDKDVDRYDSEIFGADATLGKLLALFENRRPGLVTIVSADHGEEFGDHGGRYHGSSVYEEQSRVPLVIVGPGVKTQRTREVVQTIDLLPTVLSALEVPRPPRLRGRDLGPLLAAVRPAEPGLAYAETEEQALLAEGPLRLLCARKLGACKLFDLSTDPRQTRDAQAEHTTDFNRLRAKLRELSASHGRYEQSGLRAEGRGFPPAILRGAAGDGDAAEEISTLLDDADRGIRRKAAEVLFELKRKETAPALRLALSRAEDPEVRNFAALGLTRLGEGAPLTAELLTQGDLRTRRLAALALGENGDRRGEDLLVSWWQDSKARDYPRSLELLDVFATLRTKAAEMPLLAALDDVRLRPFLARALGKIGEPAAVAPLLNALREERMQSTRVALASALVALDAGPILAPTLARFLGVPDPLPSGLELAEKAKILEHVGGLATRDLARLRKDENLGVRFTLTIPAGGDGSGVRLLLRARNAGPAPATVLFARGLDDAPSTQKNEPRRNHQLPVIDETRALRLRIPPSESSREVFATLPPELGSKPGLRASFLLYAERGVDIEALALVPLADELPPPPPQPWASEGAAPGVGSGAADPAPGHE